MLSLVNLWYFSYISSSNGVNYSKNEVIPFFMSMCMSVCVYIVTLDMKGCICHFVKWQIHPFISKVTICVYSCLFTFSAEWLIVIFQRFESTFFMKFGCETEMIQQAIRSVNKTANLDWALELPPTGKICILYVCHMPLVGHHDEAHCRTLYHWYVSANAWHENHVVPSPIFSWLLNLKHKH